VQHRLKAEYGVDARLMGSSYTGARWITADNEADLRNFIDKNQAKLALDSVDALAYLLTSPYDLRLTQERHPNIKFHALREHAGLELQKS
jgi:peptide chain release factor 3